MLIIKDRIFWLAKGRTRQVKSIPFSGLIKTKYMTKIINIIKPVKSGET